MKINRALNFKIKITILLSIIFCLHVAEYARANDLTHQWKSPAFSGSGYSSHVLTIENQEHSRKKAIREKGVSIFLLQYLVCQFTEVYILCHIFQMALFPKYFWGFQETDSLVKCK